MKTETRRDVASPIILVVEDNPTSQYVLKQLLQKFDYDSHGVASGEEALSALETTKYAAVLMDINLPGIDGYECTRRIRQLEKRPKAKRTAVIALTGRSEDSARAVAIKAGMDDFLSKPFEAEELRKILLRYVYDSNYPNLKVVRSS